MKTEEIIKELTWIKKLVRRKSEADRALDKAIKAIKNGTPLTPDELADALMEERIRGKLDSDTTFEKDIIRDVKCRLTVSIRDHRPCYCGAELREVWREKKESEDM